MNIPDPFSPLIGSIWHKIDIFIAEEFTGVPNKTISGHIVDPFVGMGYRRDSSLAVFHWLLIGILGIAGTTALLANQNRR